MTLELTEKELVLAATLSDDLMDDDDIDMKLLCQEIKRKAELLTSNSSTTLEGDYEIVRIVQNSDEECNTKKKLTRKITTFMDVVFDRSFTRKI